MAPAFHRGDVLVLWNRVDYIRAGDIPVVWFEGNPLPMVHRAVEVFHIDYHEANVQPKYFISNYAFNAKLISDLGNS